MFWMTSFTQNPRMTSNISSNRLQHLFESKVGWDSRQASKIASTFTSKSSYCDFTFLFKSVGFFAHHFHLKLRQQPSTKIPEFQPIAALYFPFLTAKMLEQLKNLETSMLQLKIEPCSKSPRNHQLPAPKSSEKGGWHHRSTWNKNTQQKGPAKFVIQKRLTKKTQKMVVT